MVPLLLFRNTAPSRASGDGWLVPPSAIGATQASCSSCALSRVIWFSGLKLLAAWSRRSIGQSLAGGLRSMSSVTRW